MIFQRNPCEGPVLDYWKHVNVEEYRDFEDFIEKRKVQDDQLFLFTKFAEKNFFNATSTKDWQQDLFLVFGSETKGLDESIMKRYSKDRYLKIPMLTHKIRSLNLSNAVTAAAYEFLRQSESY